MKIHFDIDATPQELRSFLGLPNFESLQNEMLETIRKNMTAGIDGFEAATLMKPFLPDNLTSLTALQKTFWQAVLGQSQTEKKSGEESRG